MESKIGIIFPLTYLLFVAAERLFPGRDQPRVARWWPKGLVFFAVGGIISNVLSPPVLAWTHAHRLFDLAGLGVVGGTLVGLVVGDLVGYGWHRLRHAWRPLWRIHQ